MIEVDPLLARTIDLSVDARHDTARHHAETPDRAATSGGVKAPDGASPPVVPPNSGNVGSQPETLGRYRITGMLGEGGFGRVLAGHDPELNRPVAIKMPLASRMKSPATASKYLAEAQLVARLDHPAIVPVYDFGRTAEHHPYVVSKVIDGGDLAAHVERRVFGPHESARIVAQVAEALHFAHLCGVVHRDVKPANILLDQDHNAFIGDFGTALREDEVGLRPMNSGTPHYMSPEQANGEGHRVDGRSDVFSLGVVLHELLTGKRPHDAADLAELLEQIVGRPIRPLRQRNHAIPAELDRICLKALAKKLPERYSTAQDMADDLRAWLDAESSPHDQTVSSGQPASGQPASQPATPSGSLAGGWTPEPVVPRGLLPYDEADVGFFWQLLPGARDRTGMPESVRWWKQRLESRTHDRDCGTLVLYGPAGSGKTSFLRAGVLPRLGGDVESICLEATRDRTELQLRDALRDRFPRLPQEASLCETIAFLRQANHVRKVILVIDQFEQRLCGSGRDAQSEIVKALRQCDGENVQALLVVRDDFWKPTSDLMRLLDTRILDGKNSWAIAPFDLPHASDTWNRLQNKDAADDRTRISLPIVQSIASCGRVLPYRLALLAECSQIPGHRGSSLPAAFFEHIFRAPESPLLCRSHFDAICRVLAAVLPDPGQDIASGSRSREQLAQAAGYRNRLEDFDEVMELLERRLRFISPRTSDDGAEERWQLSFGFLVAPLRQWLGDNEPQTRSSRVALKLAERCRLWSDISEPRFLPPLRDYISFRWHTRREQWSEDQRAMMRVAGRRLWLRAWMMIVATLVVGVGLVEFNGRQQAARLRQRLADVPTSEVPAVVQEAAGYRRWLLPLLREELPVATRDDAVHLKMALLPDDTGHAGSLADALLQSDAARFTTLRETLANHGDDLAPRLWRVLDDSSSPADQRFRAACALAAFDSSNEKWNDAAGFVADHLIQQNPMYVAEWLPLLTPVRDRVVEPIGNRLRRGATARASSEQAGATEIVLRSRAAWLLAEFAADQPEGVVGLLGSLEPSEFASLFPVLSANRDAAVELLNAAVAQSDRARHRAFAAAALLRLQSPLRAWPAFEHQSDPTAQSLLVHYAGKLEIASQAIAERLMVEPDAGIRRALLLALGDSDEVWDEWLAERVERLHHGDPDPGVHGAAEWLLRQHGHEIPAESQPGANRWFLNRVGQTMVVVPGERRFAIAATEVTIAQFRLFQDRHPTVPRFDTSAYTTSDDCPQTAVSWHEAAAWCNWLSDLEGIPESEWCYASASSGRGMVPVSGHLDRHGYRLPTSEEWESACRAGTSTDRWFGTDDIVRDRHAWHADNSNEIAWRVGLTVPNPLGLFDLYGNASEWCDSAFDGENRVLRGGSFNHKFRNMTSSWIYAYPPTHRFSNIGFRPARTVLTHGGR